MNEIVFTVPETWNVTVDPAITGGTLAVDPVSGSEGTPVTVTVTPDTGKKLLTGSLKYTTGDDDWTVITDTDGVYSFMLPAADVTVTVQFIDAGSPDFGITVDDTITGGSITADPVSAPAGAEITVIIVPDSGNRLASGSLKYTIDGGTTWINISCSDGGFSFIMPSSDVTVTARFETIPEAVYTIIPQTDSGYTIGSDPDGICTMTVSGDVSGFVYFRVTVTPVISHTGSETAVFVLTRDETELRYSTTVADLDVINTVSAGFNVQAGDVIKVYIVDSISNNPDFEPVFFQ